MIRPDLLTAERLISDFRLLAFVARSSADEWDNIIPYDRN